MELETGRDLGLASNSTTISTRLETEVNEYTVNITGSANRFLYNADTTDKGVVITYTVKEFTGDYSQNGVIGTTTPTVEYAYSGGQMIYNDGVDPTMLEKDVTYEITIEKTSSGMNWSYVATTAEGQSHTVNLNKPLGSLDASSQYFGLWMNGTIDVKLTNVSCVELETGRDLGLASNSTTISVTGYVEEYTAKEFRSYRSGAEYTAPEAKEGYLFAGWYEDNTCETSVGEQTKRAEKAVYAKFVQEDVLSTKGQFSKDLKSAEQATTALRLVTTVDCDDYVEVGFKVTSGTQSKHYKDITAYKQITGTGENMSFTYVPTDISKASVAFVTVVLDNISVAGTDLNREFKVQAYWKTADGTVFYGEEKPITIQMGIDVNTATTQS